MPPKSNSVSRLPRWKAKDYLRVVELYETHSASQVAAITGIPVGTVRSILKRLNVPRRPRGSSFAEFRTPNDSFAPCSGRVLTSKHALILHYLYWELGLTAKEIGEQLGISPGTVLSRMDSLGIERRPQGSIPGKQRGPYNIDWPTCATPGCETRIKLKGRKYCGVCIRESSRHG